MGRLVIDWLLVSGVGLLVSGSYWLVCEICLVSGGWSVSAS